MHAKQANQCRVQSAVTPFFQLINDKLHNYLCGTAEPSPSVTLAVAFRRILVVLVLYAVVASNPALSPAVTHSPPHSGSLRIATAPHAPDPLLAALQISYYFKAARQYSSCCHVAMKSPSTVAGLAGDGQICKCHS